MEDLKQELAELKQEIEKKNAVVIENPLETPKNETNTKVDDLVGDLINTATLSAIQNDNETKNKIIETAKTIVNTKVDTVSLQAKTENEKANFDNKKEACACFGFADKEDSLPRKAVNAMNVIHNIWLAIWIAICSFTWCPIMFISKRFHNAIKKTWITILLGIIIYLFVVAGVPTLITNLIKGGVH